MKVKIGDEIYDSEKVMISIGLYSNEKVFLHDMIVRGDDIFNSYPKGINEKQMQDFALTLQAEMEQDKAPVQEQIVVPREGSVRELLTKLGKRHSLLPKISSLLGSPESISLILGNTLLQFRF